MKIVRKIILLTVIFLILLLTLNSLKKEHHTTYKIDNYSVEENFYKNEYTIGITKKKKKFYYVLNNKMGKKKKIIKNIKTLKNNNLVCIIPEYKKEVSKEIYCNLDNKQVTLNYLIQTENEDYLNLKKEIKKNKIFIPKQNEKKDKYKNISIYKNNIKEDTYIIWDYKGIYIISKDKYKYQKILDRDLYDNIMSAVVDRYFVLFENDSVNGIKKIYYYDLKKDTLKIYEPEIILSKNSYINGVVDNLIYVTDKKNKKEYALNIKKKTITEVDSYQTQYIVYKNNKKETMSKSDFLMHEQYFNDYSLDQVIEEGQFYYYLENDYFYQALDKQKKKNVLLFRLDQINDLFIENENFYVIKDDTIYSYNGRYGLRKVITYNELRYNFKNILKIWNNSNK